MRRQVEVYVPCLRVLVAIAIGATIVSCADDSPEPLSPGLEPRKLHSIQALGESVLAPFGAQPSTNPNLQGSASARLASKVPGFGGAFVDHRRKVLVVYLVPGTDVSAAGSVIRADLIAHGRAELGVDILPGRFAFADLVKWRNALVLGYKQGVLLGEIDERSQQVRIGVVGESARVLVSARAQQLAIPEGAVNVHVTKIPEPYATLRSAIRPMPAGMQIVGSFEQDGAHYELTCTYGPNVTYDGSAHMVVNSHCTQVGTLGGLIGALMYQPGDREFDRYGTEVQDPARSSTLYGCPSGELCRYSDAALVRANASCYLCDPRTDLGAIARTVQRVTLPTVYGLLDIDDANPRINLTGILSSLYVGDTLDKVGRTTGWSAGEVTSTSSTISLADGTRLDNVTVRAGSGGGDSGSPVVFKTSAGEYMLAGILWGGIRDYNSESGTTFYYSKWSQVDYELGSPAVDLYPIPGSSGGGGGGGGSCSPDCPEPL